MQQDREIVINNDVLQYIEQGCEANTPSGDYRQRCWDYIDTLPAAMPWCDYITILKALPINNSICRGVNCE